MNITKEELQDEYMANECIWKSANATSSEKAAAWRRQALILQDPRHELSARESYDIMSHHYKKLDADCFVEYRKERLLNVEEMLSGFKAKQSEIELDTVDDTDFLSGIEYEPPCHGIYESCRSLEVTDTDMQLLLKTAKPIKITTSCSAISQKPTSSKNASNFFQPKLNAAQVSTKSGNLATNSSSQRENVEKIAEDNSIDSAPFRTAREMLIQQQLKNNQADIKKYLTNNSASTSSSNRNSVNNSATPTYFNYGITKKMLGTRRTVRSGFVLPVATDGSNSLKSNTMEINPSPPINSSPEEVDERLTNIDPKMVELIKSEIMHNYQAVSWDDVVGLNYAKSIIKEAVVYPLLRPDIFTGLRRPPRGILLFGPPGTGKTLIGKCIASQSQSTFFSISASSLTSKWVGDSEKMVRALFAVAAVHQPAVVFIDEVDSLLAKRSETEHDSSRKLKNEFLVQLDGATTSAEERILIVGATNRPQELDDAARRRFARRLYIPLPELEARVQILKNLLKTVTNNLTSDEIEQIGLYTDGYSGADMNILCREASMEPLRTIPIEQIEHIDKDKVPPVTVNDFQSALQSVRPSVSKDDLAQYIKWNSEYGACKTR